MGYIRRRSKMPLLSGLYRRLRLPPVVRSPLPAILSLEDWTPPQCSTAPCFMLSRNVVWRRGLLLVVSDVGAKCHCSAAGDAVQKSAFAASGAQPVACDFEFGGSATSA